MRARALRPLLCAALALGLLAACGDAEPPARPTTPTLAKELIFLSWAEDLPESIMEEFTKEHGVKVIYQSYETTEEAITKLRAGQVYDVVVIDSPYVPELAAEGLLAEIDHRNVPNFKHISPNFRDLAYDPGNRYSVTYNWGLTGLLARADLIEQPVTGWNDLWDPRYAGRVLVFDLPNYLLGIALQSLGFSINSEDPAELEAALARLLALKANARTSGYVVPDSDELFANGEIVIMYGWAGDVLRARARGLDVEYVLPVQGSIQWADNFVIPAASPNQYTAEAFIDFLLRPEISARIVNEQHYATANEAAYPLINPEIRNDPVIFPPIEDMRRAEVYMPLSPAGKTLHDDVWQRYMAGAAEAASSD
ncbi:MAG: spermidine/putrescine ABC transporter substrate-binding protein [Candidatus Competibacteraceae bacterium]|nr:MAG: spermidine/putrescine ABC transporter substrate-binding protein [Candidatus Competibacteraceae bacterium]